MKRAIRDFVCSFIAYGISHIDDRAVDRVRIYVFRACSCSSAYFGLYDQAASQQVKRPYGGFCHERRRLESAYKDAGTDSYFDNSSNLECNNSFSDGSSTNPKTLSQQSFRRQAIAGPQGAARDQLEYFVRKPLIGSLRHASIVPTKIGNGG